MFRRKATVKQYDGRSYNFFNGLLGIVYYVAEAAMYQQPLALVFLVLASLFSSFLIRPLASLFHIHGGEATPASVLVLGIVGSLLCIAEVPVRWNPFRKQQPGLPPPSNNPLLELSLVHSDHRPDSERSALLAAQSRSFGSSTMDLDNVPERSTGKESLSHRHSASHVILTWIKVLVPFLMLSFTYAMWFVAMKYFNDKYHQNVFGYTSLDQGLLPMYLVILFVLLDRVPPVRAWFESEVEDRSCSLDDAFPRAFSESNLIETFLYRFFINGRAMLYFYLAVWYDLNKIYLQLTLFRILISWVASAILVLVFPRWIRSSPHEKSVLLHPPNLALRLVGSSCIIASIVLVA